MLSKSGRQAVAVVEALAIRGKFTLASNGFCPQRLLTSQRRMMQTHGFRYLGGGAYSTVFTSRALANCAVKITTALDDGYHTYVDWLVRQRPKMPAYVRKFFPEILHTEIICGVRITVIEQLEHSDERGCYSRDCVIRECLRDGTDNACDDDDSEMQEAREAGQWLRDEFDCHDLVRFDMHAGNFMRRVSDGCLVVTDPLAGRLSGNTGDDEYNASASEEEEEECWGTNESEEDSYAEAEGTA